MPGTRRRRAGRARTAASVSVQSTTSRWAWLPPICHRSKRSDQVRGVRFEDAARMVIIPPPRRIGESEEHREITWKRTAAE
jgi:hypothetical protein